jgi:glutathione S-transferase
MALAFYYGSGSPYAWKVWLALEHKGVAYEFHRLSFDGGDLKTPAFRAVSPRGKVPAIVDDGFALAESSAIVEYLEERHPEKPLLPADARGRATARRLAAEADHYLSARVSALFRLTLFAKAPVERAALDAAREEALEELQRWEAALAGPYLAGALSLADFTAYPHMRLLLRIEERRPGDGIAPARLPAKLGTWMKRIEALPYYAKTIPPHWQG